MSEIVAGLETCPSYATLFGYLGATSCVVLSNWGSAWGTWKAGIGVCNMGVNYPSGVIKNIVPIVMAGVLGIYGLIVAVIITQDIKSPDKDGNNSYSTFNGYAHLAAGLCCGISCLVAGGTIGMIGDVGVRVFGLKATNGKRAWASGEGMDAGDARGDDFGSGGASNVEDANKLYVSLLIMLIFSEALALYGLIVALILSQHKYNCGDE